MNPPYDAHFRTHWACWQARLSRQTWAEAQSWPPLVREATLWPELLQRLRRATGAAAIVPARMAQAGTHWRVLPLQDWRAHWASLAHRSRDEAASAAGAAAMSKHELLACPVGDRGHVLVGWPAAAIWQDWPGRPALSHDDDWPLWLADLPASADWTRPEVAATAQALPPLPSPHDMLALQALLGQASPWLQPVPAVSGDEEASAGLPTYQWVSTSLPLHDFLATWRSTGESLDAADSAVPWQSGWVLGEDAAPPEQPARLGWHWGLDHPGDAIARLRRCLSQLRRAAASGKPEAAPPPATVHAPVPASAGLGEPPETAALKASSPAERPALLILLHGAMQGPQAFLPVQEHLALDDLAVFQPALPASWPGIEATPAAELVPQLAREVAAQAAALWPDIPPTRWCVAGHSLGSLVALEMGRQALVPLAGLCLLGSAYPMPVSARLLDGAESDWRATQATLHWASLADPEHVLCVPGRAPLQTQALHDELMGASRPGSPETLALFKQLFSGCDQYRWPGDWPPADPAQLARQRVVIQGRDDRLTRLSQGEALGHALQAELHSIDAGHALLLEAPQAVAGLLAELLHLPRRDAAGPVAEAMPTGPGALSPGQGA